MVICGIP